MYERTTGWRWRWIRGQGVAVQLEAYLHDAVPVVPGGDLEQCEEGHAEVLKGGVATHPLARVVSVTHWEGERTTQLINTQHVHQQLTNTLGTNTTDQVEKYMDR